MPRMDEDLDYTLETWGAKGSVERILARTCNASVGRGAFAAAVEMYPDAHITLRQMCRVVAEHPKHKRTKGEDDEIVTTSSASVANPPGLP